MLASCTALNIFSDIEGQARPPELGSNGLAGLQVARMAGSLVIVAMVKNGVAKGFIVGDIDMILVGQEPASWKHRSERGGEYLCSWIEELGGQGDHQQRWIQCGEREQHQ